MELFIIGVYCQISKHARKGDYGANLGSINHRISSDWSSP
jgi:hypothetical protein